MTQLTDKVYAVQVPDDANDFEVEGYKVRNAIDERDGQMLVWASLQATHNFIILSRGNWRFLFTTKQATEEQAASVVEGVDSEGRGPIYMNYENGMYVFHKPQSSLRSLLRSRGCSYLLNHALIQKDGE